MVEADGDTVILVKTGTTLLTVTQAVLVTEPLVADTV
jgi:hypothetical protein